jgi:uncharacterized phage-associated protein
MRFPFDEPKATQVAAYLLKLAGRRVEYLHLIKLMYLADREMLVKRGKTITGDKLVSMSKGPVLSCVYNLIKDGPVGSPSKTTWFTFISRNATDVSLTMEAPTDTLSRFELAILDEVFKKFGGMNRWDLVEHLHHMLPEWDKDVGNSSSEIDPETILRNAEWSDEDIEQAKASAAEARFYASLG